MITLVYARPPLIILYICSDNIPSSVFIDFLRRQLDVEIVFFTLPPAEPTIGMTQRFMSAADPSVDAFLVRDLDSRLSLRERYGVCVYGP